MTSAKPYIAIACGGTGGHLFPGLAVAEQLKLRGCDVALLISPKDVDQQAVKSARGMETFTLPAVALQNGNYASFALSFWNSFRAARKLFRQRRPAAVLAMGGFTSAPPIFAARLVRAKTFLHESNTIPGKANRFLARFVDEAFTGFPDTAALLRARKITTTGTPVRPEFQIRDPRQCRVALGLDPDRPTILVVGGSQGASGLNAMVLSALPLLASRNWQWIHLTGAKDLEQVRLTYASLRIPALIKPFLPEIPQALASATAAVSRAGASSLAEMAALRLPSLLVPFPAAADNHQFFNARIFALSGSARLLEQKESSPEKVAAILTGLVDDADQRAKMQSALALWHSPKSAEMIAGSILQLAFKAVDLSDTGESPSKRGLGGLSRGAKSFRE